MYAGTTQTITSTITQSVAFTVLTPTVVITLPDGTTDSNPSVSVSPGGNAVQQTLVAAYTPRMGGLHTRVWTYFIGAQQYTITEYFWVTWTECYSAVRTNLGMTSTSLPDGTIDEEFQSVVTEITALSNVQYSQLTGTDPKTFDTAMKWIMSSEFRSWSPKTGAIGELIGFRKGTTYLQYAGRNENPKSPEEIWLKKGWLIMMTIPSIAAVLEAHDYTNILPTRGPVMASNQIGTQGDAVDTLFAGEMG